MIFFEDRATFTPRFPTFFTLHHRIVRIVRIVQGSCPLQLDHISSSALELPGYRLPAATSIDPRTVSGASQLVLQRLLLIIKSKQLTYIQLVCSSATLLCYATLVEISRAFSIASPL